MKIWAFTYSTDNYVGARKLNIRTAKKQGADNVLEFTPRDIDADFYHRNQNILGSAKGAGFWLWKPYFVNRVMDMAADGDWIVYFDAGIFYINNIARFIDEMENEGNTLIVSADGGYIEYEYTKRDTFVFMDMDTPEYTHSSQFIANAMLIKKTDDNVRMVRDWLKYAQDRRCISDDKNVSGLDNYPGFIDHRYDQSIFSLCCKKHCKVVRKLIFEPIHMRKYSRAIGSYHHTRFGFVPQIVFVNSEFYLKTKKLLKRVLGRD